MEEVEIIENVKKVKDSKWYAIQVVSGKERKVIENLELELRLENLEKYVEQILCPMEVEYKMRNGKKVKRDKLIFPGYIFIKANVIGELPRIVKNVKFIMDFTKDSATGKPAEVRQSEIDRIFGTIKKSESVEASFVVGEPVMVIDGPFSSFKGDIESIDDKAQKLKVNVMVFGRPTPLELSFMQIERIKE